MTRLVALLPAITAAHSAMHSDTEPTVLSQPCLAYGAAGLDVPTELQSQTSPPCAELRRITKRRGLWKS